MAKFNDFDQAVVAEGFRCQDRLRRLIARHYADKDLEQSKVLSAAWVGVLLQEAIDMVALFQEPTPDMAARKREAMLAAVKAMGEVFPALKGANVFIPPSN